MTVKTFGDKKITIRTITRADLKNVKKFQVFSNSLIGEEAKILMNEKLTLKDEADFLERNLKGAKNKTRVYLVAEYKNKIIGAADVNLFRWRSNHMGGFGIMIIDEYRGIGLGKYLMAEIIKLAKKELKPKLKIIKLEVYANNTPAIGLYKKMGFKVVAKIPKQIQWKGKLIDELVMLKYL